MTSEELVTKDSHSFHYCLELQQVSISWSYTNGEHSEFLGVFAESTPEDNCKCSSSRTVQCVSAARIGQSPAKPPWRQLWHLYKSYDAEKINQHNRKNILILSQTSLGLSVSLSGHVTLSMLISAYWTSVSIFLKAGVDVKGNNSFHKGLL